MKPWTRSGLIVAAVPLALACRDDPAPPPHGAEAGPVAVPEGTHLVHGLIVRPPDNWIRVTGEPPTFRRVRPPERAFLVVPRLAITSEPSRSPEVADEARRVLEEVRRTLREGGAELRSSSLRVLPQAVGAVGDVEVVYRVSATDSDERRQVVHHAWVITNRPEVGSHETITFTLTYLSEDADEVAPDIADWLSGLSRPDPQGAQ